MGRVNHSLNADSEINFKVEKKKSPSKMQIRFHIRSSTNVDYF